MTMLQVDGATGEPEAHRTALRQSRASPCEGRLPEVFASPHPGKRSAFNVKPSRLHLSQTAREQLANGSHQHRSQDRQYLGKRVLQ